MSFDRVAMLDWSSAGRAKTGKDSIWLAVADDDGVQTHNLSTRHLAEAALVAQIERSIAADQRLLLGVDFSLGYPKGFARVLTGRASALSVWAWLASRIKDDAQNTHNLRAVAAQANGLFDGDGPFWGNGSKTDMPGLPPSKPALPRALDAYRATEKAALADGLTPKTQWQLSGVGAVGAQSLTGLPMLHRLRLRFGGDLAIWPFEAPDAKVVIAEIYPAMRQDAAQAAAREHGLVLDEAQMRVMAQTFVSLSRAGALDAMFQTPLSDDLMQEEGWILGQGHADALRAADHTTPQPRLRNDCFAMPPGVHWMPVDEALDRLRQRLRPVVGTAQCATGQAKGRVLARDHLARRSNPPQPNAAVDGYGFAYASLGSGAQSLPLVAGRSAAGDPFAGQVPAGHAIRILTGAVVPSGVDTVVLQEDCQIADGTVHFNGTVKIGANTRKAGEDVMEGAVALPQGHCLRPPDLALLAALGVGQVDVFRKLRVGVLSTGDEIVPSADMPAAPHQIWDANRPMLLAMADAWGYAPVDLGHVPDDPVEMKDRFDQAARQVDVILTSGGASAGDEDHVSRLLREQADLTSWRIAIKPGRPLALAMWDEVPVFGLPGNPVAAFVCALIFARPAMAALSGAGWKDPVGYLVPAAFSKTKKAGRREFLRARMNADGAAEVFASEGSGRISGLAWAEGLVELPDEAMTVAPGDLVRFYPYGAFNL